MAREAGQAVTSFTVRRQFGDGNEVFSIIDWEMALLGVGRMTSAELLEVGRLAEGGGLDRLWPDGLELARRLRADRARRRYGRHGREHLRAEQPQCRPIGKRSRVGAAELRADRQPQPDRRRRRGWEFPGAKASGEALSARLVLLSIRYRSTTGRISIVAPSRVAGIR